MLNLQEVMTWIQMKVYQALDVLGQEQPMKWNYETYEEHIESVVTLIGEYKGKKYCLARRPTNDYWFGENNTIYPTDETRIFDNLGRAILYFTIYEPIQGGI